MGKIIWDKMINGQGIGGGGLGTGVSSLLGEILDE